MDPEANLNEQLEAARDIIARFDAIPDVDENPDFWGDEQDRSDFFESLADSGQRLAELVLALDEWRRKGGFDPYTTIKPEER